MQQHKVGIILGHHYTGLSMTARQKRRLQKGLELFKAAQVTHVMTTGGKGMWKKSAPSMGEVARTYLVAHGVEPSRILVEDQSINTVQNAQYALRLMQQHGLTSADHMPRAAHVFMEIFPPTYQLDFAISDSFCGIWSIIDFFWNSAGNLKRALRKSAGVPLTSNR